MEEITKERKSNIELLRIISMFLIILHHLIYHNGVFLINNSNQTMAIILYSGAKIAVTCYILILRYFSLYSKFDIKKPISIFLEMLFYSLISIVVFNMGSKLDLNSITKVIDGYWFIIGYIIIYLLSPFLKIYAKTMPKILQLITIYNILRNTKFLYRKYLSIYSMVHFNILDWNVHKKKCNKKIL